MSTRSTRTSPKSKTISPRAIPQSISIASQGINTTLELAKLMSALISDLAEDRISTQVANAICNASGRLLKVAEIQFKFGTANGKQNRPLCLTSSGEE